MLFANSTNLNQFLKKWQNLIVWGRT